MMTRWIATLPRRAGGLTRAAALLLALLTGLSASGLILVTPVGPTIALAAAEVDDERAGRPGPIEFTPCAEFPALECGTLHLPVDYRHQRGDTFDMAVIRARAGRWPLQCHHVQ